MNTRPVSIAHLVFGLIFLGASVLWAIGAGTGADAPDLALLAPIVLIGAGVVGLVGIVVNGRNASRRDAVPDLSAASPEPSYAGTGPETGPETGPGTGTETGRTHEEEER